MELQKFINGNSDYIKVIRKHDIHVIKDKSMDIAILKYNRNKINKYEYENNQWMKYCKGAVIDLKINKVICVPPLKSNENKDINNIVSEYTQGNIYQPLIDGTMINMFYKDNKWIICTRSNIGANNSWDGKVKFKDLFIEINGKEWFNKLDKNNCYSFVFQHKKNRIVTPVIENRIFMIHSYNIEGENPIRCDTLPTIDGITNIFNITEEDIKEYLNQPLYYSIKGLSIISENNRVKWINPEFNKVFHIKPNNNNKFLNYMELSKNSKLNEYMQYFPEDNQVFTEYYNKFLNFRNILYKTYINIHIAKKNTLKDVNYILKPLIYELHGDYLKTREKISINKVNNYIMGLPDVKVLFIINRL